jgi:pimeloyl-ACP methyl ester carboxylesterase
MAYGLAAIVGLVILLAAIGATYQLIEDRADRRAAAVPGRLIDVGGYRMHIVCTGEGSPAVILEAGLGDSWLAWNKVQPPISRFARVCSYDRAGMGLSDPRPHAPDSLAVAGDLHALLGQAGVSPPYVLVGHSTGGIHVRVFRELYPREVVAMVLIDATAPDFFGRAPPAAVKRLTPPIWLGRLMAWTAPLGVPRLIGACGGGPPQLAALQRTFECRGRFFAAAMAEIGAVEAITREGRAAGALDAMPLVVLSHDPTIGLAPGALPPALNRQFEAQWALSQHDLARLSSRGEQVVATGNGHYIQDARPDLVIAAVREVTDQSRPPAPTPAP